METPVLIGLISVLSVAFVQFSGAEMRTFQDGMVVEYNTESESTLSSVYFKFKDGEPRRTSMEILFHTSAEEEVILYHDGKAVSFNFTEQSTSGTEIYTGRCALDTSREWHTVSLTFDTVTANLEVDGYSFYVYVNKLPPLGTKIVVGDSTNFTGCMDNFTLNGDKIQDTEAFNGLPAGCSYPSYLASFRGADSFFNMSIEADTNTTEFDLFLAFRTFTPVLDLAELQLASGGTIQMSLSDPITIKVKHGNGEITCTHELVKTLNDGTYHDVAVAIFLTQDNPVALLVDGNAMAQSQTGTTDLKSDKIVGVNLGSFTGGSGTDGCFRNVELRLAGTVRKFLSDFTINNAVIGECPDKDWCAYEPCAHGRPCKQTRTGTTYSCDCSNSGYEGSDCLTDWNTTLSCYNNIFKFPSTELIDPDGTGDDTYFIATCIEGPDGVIWTQVESSATNIPVTEYPYAKDIQYGGKRADQIQGLIQRSGECKQTVSFTCTNSRLMTRMGDGEVPYGYWEGGSPPMPHYYWGGSNASFEYSCSGGSPCQCDTPMASGVTDAGDLTTKEHLPVSKVYFNETTEQGVSKSAQYTIGPLMCRDDVYLADSSGVTFTGNSSLMIDRSPGDVPVDISFSFKTKSVKGYLIHSEVIRKDNTPEVYFAIGIANRFELFVTIKSREIYMDSIPVPVYILRPIDNGEWHNLYFEMNHEQAFLKIDSTPVFVWRTEEFLPYPKLFPTSRLFLGGSPEGDNAFTGCIKNLRVLGEYVDLHAEVETDDILKGCRGQCDSNPCLNGGTCEEYYSTFKCTCTGYTGCYCGKDSSWQIPENTSAMSDNGDFTANPNSIFELGFSTQKSDSSLARLTEAAMVAKFSIDQNGYLLAEVTSDSQVSEATFDVRVDDNMPHYVRILKTEGTELLLQLDEMNKTLEVQQFPMSQPHQIVLGKVDGSLFPNQTFDGCVFSIKSGGKKITLDGQATQSSCAPSLVPAGLKEHKQQLMAHIENSKISNDARLPPRVESLSVINPKSEVMNDKQVFLIQPVTLVCDADGVPSPRIVWKKDGIVQETDCVHRLTKKSLVLLPDGSGGVYSCEAHNRWGVSASVNDITVRKTEWGAPGPTTEPPVSMSKGDKFTRECNIGTGSVPTAVPVWEKLIGTQSDNINRQIIWQRSHDMNDRITATKDGTLLIRYVLPEDDSSKEDTRFACSAVNPATGERAEILVIRLTIVDNGDGYLTQPPSITYSTPSPVDAVENDDIILECLIRDFAVPRSARITWYHNDKTVGIDAAYGQALRLNSISADQAGEYACVLSETLMENITVNVQSCPKLAAYPGKVMKYNGEEAVFMCKLNIENYTVGWFSNGNPLNTASDRYVLDETNSTLTIRNISKDRDLQTIRCITQADSCTAISEGFLSVVDKLVISRSPNDVIMEMTKKRPVHFSLEVMADPIFSPVYTWLKDNSSLNGIIPENNNAAEIVSIVSTNSGSTLTLDSTKMTDNDLILFRGRYSCSVSDGISITTASAHLFIKTPSETGLSTGAVIGIVVGSILGFALLAALIGYYFFNKNRSNRKYGIEGTVGAYKNPAYSN